MLRPQRLIKKQNAEVQSVPAPVGGWNARDSLANMEITDAVQLENMFPTVNSVQIRGGYSSWATGLGSQVESLFTYAGGATSKLFAAAGTSIWDVTSSGAVGAASLTGLTNARWQHVNVSTTGGNYVYIVNGVDSARVFDGTVWSTPAITVATSSTFSQVELFKNRVWFIQKNTLKAWYLPTSAISGAAASLDLSSVARRGGYLVAVATWTLDAGYGVDDNLVFVTSEGEVIVYRGTDPASAATWALTGLWQLGAPIGTRCVYKYAGDLLILTYDGLFPLASALQSSRLDPRVALSDKIQGAMALATYNYGTTFGWDITYSSKDNALWVNVPVAAGSQQQYVMNSITKAWCQFTGWAANCHEVFSNTPYFGGNGAVYKSWTADHTDNAAAIQTNTIQAFNYFGTRGTKKQFTRARPTLLTDGIPSTFIGMNVDFDLSDTTAALTFSPGTTALWDTSLWDAAVWGAGLAVNNGWQGIAGIGTCGGLHLKTSSKGMDIQWPATDVVYQSGWPGV